MARAGRRAHEGRKALAESVHGLDGREPRSRSPGGRLTDASSRPRPGAAWWNTWRLYGALGDITPAEFVAAQHQRPKRPPGPPASKQFGPRHRRYGPGPSFSAQFPRLSASAPLGAP